MNTRLVVHLDFSSDFHVGTGAGLGRVVDAMIARNVAGEPVVPGATLKGLARDAAMRLPKSLRGQDETRITRVFGARGSVQGAARFGDAVPTRTWLSPTVHGRSARDRQTGRVLDGALFRVEDAAAARMKAQVTASHILEEHDLVLLVTALRRIEWIGGQRRRGKGRVSVSVEITEGPEEWRGISVPDAPGAFDLALRTALGLDVPADGQETTPSSAGVAKPDSLQQPSFDARSADESAVLWLVARAEAPLVLSAVPEVGNTIRTLTHVPGTALRGAVAAYLLGAGWKTEEATFRQAFVEEVVHFGPLYPCLPWERQRSFPFPVPASLATCKYHDGLRVQKARAHGVVDLLGTGDPLILCGNEGCNAPLIRLDGFLQGEYYATEDQTELRVSKPATRFAAHVAIDPYTQRAEEQALYGHEQIAEGTWMAGYLWGPAAILAVLRERLNDVIVTVGRARTRGHGDLKLIVRAPDPGLHAAYPGLLRDRTDAEEDNFPDGFTLTLYSDLIALDCLLRPVTRLDAGTLWSHLAGEEKPPFEIERGYTTTRTVLGFNGVPGRPRTMDLALVAGSTWRFRWTDESRRDDARSRLAKAEREGLGLRRGEGYGRVLVDFPVHAVRLDETRSDAPDIPLATVNLHAETGRVPWEQSVRAPAPVPDEFPVSAVRPADCTGLARLLRQVAGEADPAVRLKSVLDDRKERPKGEPSEVDELLEAIVAHRNRISLADELCACARQLDLNAAPVAGSPGEEDGKHA